MVATADVQKMRCDPLPRTQVRPVFTGEHSRMQVRPASRALFLTSVLPKSSLRGGKTEACGQYQNLKNLQEVSKMEIQEPFLGESIHSQPLDDEESAPKRIRTFNLLIRSLTLACYQMFA